MRRSIIGSRRLISQGLTNIIKNATEAIAAVPPKEIDRGRIKVQVKRDAASDLGLSVGRIGAALRTLVAGETVGNWRAPDDQTYDVNVRLAPEARVPAVLRLVSELGGEAELAAGEPAMVVGHNCPLRAVVADYPQACLLLEAFVQALLPDMTIHEACERPGLSGDGQTAGGMATDGVPRCRFIVQRATAG